MRIKLILTFWQLVFINLITSKKPKNPKPKQFDSINLHPDPLPYKLDFPTKPELANLVQPESRTNFVQTPGSTCGVKPPNRIVGGSIVSQVNARPYPWQVFLVLGTASSPFSNSCGGSLISSSYILTAAHCAFGKQIGYSLACYGQDQIPEIINQITFEYITEFNIHPDYVNDIILYQEFVKDVATIKVENPINLDSESFPICLPPPGLCLEGGTDAIIMGYGNEDSNRKKRATLFERNFKHLAVKIEKTADCNTRMFYRAGIPVGQQNICVAGDGDGSTCQGDSGGPLVWKSDDDHHYTLGIVSYGVGCGRIGVPSVQSRVTPYLDFIISSSDVLIDGVSDYTEIECNDSLESTFGSTGIQGPTFDLSTKINDRFKHIKLKEGDDSLCIVAEAVTLGHIEISRGDRLYFTQCTDDYFSEWVWDSETKQIKTGGQNYDVLCWRTYGMLHDKYQVIQTTDCDSDDMRQRFEYDSRAGSVRQGKKFLRLNKEVVSKMAVNTFYKKPKEFKWTILEGDDGIKDYMLKYNEGKYRQRRYKPCARIWRSKGGKEGHLKPNKCPQKPFKEESNYSAMYKVEKGFNGGLTENPNLETSEMMLRSKFRSHLCLNLQVAKDGNRYVNFKTCDSNEITQRFYDNTDRKHDVKLCLFSKQHICVAYNRDGGLVHSFMPAVIKRGDA